VITLVCNGHRLCEARARPRLPKPSDRSRQTLRRRAASNAGELPRTGLGARVAR
jgi:hypothetical protein